jgi:hypothetical protein
VLVRSRERGKKEERIGEKEKEGKEGKLISQPVLGWNDSIR